VTQLPIVTTTGSRYRPDFAWPQWRLIAEADGRAAHVRASRLDADRARDADLAGEGWLTLRFTRIQVLAEAAIVEDRLLRTAFARGWVPGRDGSAAARPRLSGSARNAA
jgi:very-short-patch-repair endonuclease